MVEAADIDWETINAKLPYERSAEAKEKRRELFKLFDPNSNGYLSLAEVSIIYLISFETTPLKFRRTIFLSLYIYIFVHFLRSIKE